MLKRNLAIKCLTAALMGLPATVALAQTEVRYQYDARGRLVSVTDTGGATAIYLLDAAGNRKGFDSCGGTLISGPEQFIELQGVGLIAALSESTLSSVESALACANLKSVVSEGGDDDES